VNGLLVLAYGRLLTSSERNGRRYRIAVWLSSWAGIAVLLTANISAAPELSLQPILLAGWPTDRVLDSTETNRPGYG
jgi:hypothetical protein